MRSCGWPTIGVLLVLTIGFSLHAVPRGGDEETAPTAGRVVISEAGLPGVDRGLQENDPPRDPSGTPAAQDPIVADRTYDPTLPYEPGRVIVKFKGGGVANVTAAMAEVGATTVEQPSYADFNVLTIPSEQDPEEAARQLGERADVEYAQAAYRVHPMFRPNDPLYPNQWNWPLIDMERSWDIQMGASPSIIVAVVDTGVAFRNALIRYTARAFTLLPANIPYPALGPIDVPFAAAPELGAEKFAAPFDFIWGDPNPVDLEGHGTHVSGTIGQLTNNGSGVAGMAFNVRIMPVKVISGSWDVIFNAPNRGTDDIVARGIRYAADNGAKVINMSIGRGGPAAPVIEEAIRYATSKGVFVAISNGNGFEDGNPIERYAEIASRVDGAMSVAALARDRSRSYFSTTGAYTEIAAPGGDLRRFGAPGGVLQQTYDFGFVQTFLRPPSQYGAPRFDMFAYVYSQGTSMAAPHVSGFAALLIQQGITKPEAIEAAIRNTATDIGAPGRDNEFGFGMINPRGALRGLGIAR
ncbi:MAG: S8 family serine peptidase [Acidobacteria bacterium]|nr:S8 family serine peptidase [Acidobacteriota bacterium]